MRQAVRCEPQEYFVYFKERNGRPVGKDPERLEDILGACPKEKTYRIANPSKVQCDTKVSHICIFSYDGTDRIRFTGQDY